MNSDGFERLVVFTLDGQRYALALSAVERIVPSVEITSLPQAPEIVMGVINLNGRIIPVTNIRKRFRLPDRYQSLNDQIIIANTSRRTVGILVDGASEVLQLSGREVIPKEKIVPGMEFVSGVVKLKDGIVLIYDLEYDLDQFLSLENETALNAALEATR